MKNLRSDFLALGYTVRRCAGVFFKDGLSVFLALLAPIIVFLLYVLFLGDLQSDALLEYFPAGMADEKAVSAFVDSWMIAGVLGTACITVSFSANNIMVGDRERGVVNDFIAAPMKKSVLLGAYFVFNFLVTAAICTIVFFIGLIYLAATHSFYMSAADVFSAFGTILYGSLSATLISVPVCASFKTQGALGGFSGIVSAAIGDRFPHRRVYAAVHLPVVDRERGGGAAGHSHLGFVPQFLHERRARKPHCGYARRRGEFHCREFFYEIPVLRR